MADKGSIWTVGPETKRIEGLKALGAEFWIEIKCELSIGEQRRANTGGFRGMAKIEAPEPGGAEKTEIAIDWQARTFARTAEYLVDWSLMDNDKNKLPIERSTIEALRQPVYAAIEKAINDHVEAQEKLEKNGPSGGTAPSGTSS